MSIAVEINILNKFTGIAVNNLLSDFLNVLNKKISLFVCISARININPKFWIIKTEETSRISRIVRNPLILKNAGIMSKLRIICSFFNIKLFNAKCLTAPNVDSVINTNKD